ncbi:MAG: lipid A biosynthesis protein [Nitrospinae bacterium CG22_combo_CG10-13_8_21_14_all_47_10]|nr:MAG: lipid A biosynthesis protein [Nitrospinae bacterium CG22_combo_CG10-13_8_21_14_all_47_10]
MTANQWMIIGFVGQALFGARFLIQWIVSEKKGESTFPLAFWYCSIGGAIVLLAYAIHRQDPVFIVGQSLGSVIYIRNLVLIDRKRKSMASVGTDNEQMEN